MTAPNGMTPAEVAEKIAEWAELQYDPGQIALALDLDAEYLGKLIKNRAHPYWKAYHQGRLRGEATVRKSLYDLARHGSSPAQKQFLERIVSDLPQQTPHSQAELPPHASQAQVARMWSVSRQAVSKALTEKRLKRARTDKRRVDVASAIELWGQPANVPSSGMPGAQRQAQNVDTARAAKLSAEAELAELRSARERGQLLPREQVEGSVAAVMSVLRQTVMGLADRLPMQLAAESDPAIIRATLVAETRRALAEAAEQLARVTDEAEQ